MENEPPIIFISPPGPTPGTEALGTSVAFFVLALVGLLLAYLAVRWSRRRQAGPQAGTGAVAGRFFSRSHPRCQWRKDRKPHGPNLTRWTCQGCGVDAFTRDGRAPKECKRKLKAATL